MSFLLSVPGKYTAHVTIGRGGENSLFVLFMKANKSTSSWIEHVKHAKLLIVLNMICDLLACLHIMVTINVMYL